MNTVIDNLKSIIKSNGLKQKYVAEKLDLLLKILAICLMVVNALKLKM